MMDGYALAWTGREVVGKGGLPQRVSACITVYWSKIGLIFMSFSMALLKIFYFIYRIRYLLNLCGSVID